MLPRINESLDDDVVSYGNGVVWTFIHPELELGLIIKGLRGWSPVWGLITPPKKCSELMDFTCACMVVDCTVWTTLAIFFVVYKNK